MNKFDDRDYRSYYNSMTKYRNCGVEWNLTFEEWLDWWNATGHYHERGRKTGQYVMVRKDITKPFALDNIECKVSGSQIVNKKGVPKVKVLKPGGTITVVRKCPHCKKSPGLTRVDNHFDNCPQRKKV